jgi:hypothetical protein
MPACGVAVSTDRGRGKRGLRGAYPEADIADRTWPTVTYQVAVEVPAGNPNWFRIEDFVERLKSSGQLDGDPMADFISAVTSATHDGVSFHNDCIPPPPPDP